MSNIFEKFNKALDVEGLKKDIGEVSSNNSEYKEVPHGKYEVSITKMELKASKSGNPMLSAWLQIVEGEYKGSIIFYHQVMTSAYGIHNACEFLRSLQLETEIKFDDFVQFGTMVSTLFDVEVKEKLEFVLDYGKNNKGFNTYKIEEVFEK